MSVSEQSAPRTFEEWQRLLLETDLFPDVQEPLCSVLAAAGIVFGDLAEDVPEVRHARLPTGWQKLRDRECHWKVDLVDKDGHIRCEIDCLDTPDGIPIVEATPRFKAWCYSCHGGGVSGYVWDDDRHEQRFEIFADSPAGDEETAALSKLHHWLDNEYPEWRNPNAYRDEG